MKTPILAMMLLGISAFYIPVTVSAANYSSLGLAWRYQAQYYLKDNSEGGRATVEAGIKAIIDATTAAAPGLVKAWNYGPDLGLSEQLYPGFKYKNADFTLRADFETRENITVFWQSLSKNQVYNDFVSANIKKAVHLELLPSPYTYAPGSTITRFNIAYKFKNDNVASNQVQPAVQKWVNWAQTAPARPLVANVGADLGIGSYLYSGPRNYQFGGVLNFNSTADLVTFWEWLYPQAEYQALLKKVVDVSYIQYTVRIKA